ncbi:MAG TPA: type II secretion system F family protein [Stellaceae bacterium]|nr:type II secretion system F family protein [Stellaceae bacterium]
MISIATLATLLLLIGGVAIVGVALVGGSNERTLAGRIDLARGATLEKPAVERTTVPDWQERALGSLQALFMIRMRRNWGVTRRPLFLLIVAVMAAVIAWLVATLGAHFSGSVGLLCGVVAFFLVPRIVVMREQTRADRQFSELLPDAIDMVVRIVRAGMPVGAAVRTVGQEGNPPLSTTFSRVADQASIGVPFDEALTRVAGSIGNVDFRFFAVAVALQQMTGGNLAATLETLSTIIRRRRAVILKAHAASAEVRMSALILGSIPFFVLGALLLVAPTYLKPLFSDFRGNIILGLAMFLLFLAFMTMRTMIRNALAT